MNEITVTRDRTNLAMAAAAVALYALLLPVSAHTPVNDGLGPDGLAFGEMVRRFTLKGGDEVTRLSPLFPAIAWLPFALTGSVVTALAILNRLALGVLVFAACRLLDARNVAARWKAVVALHLALAIAFTRFAAFMPARPELCALAALMLAIALSTARRPAITAAAHVAAVTAMPVGLVAPIYGIARARRAGEPFHVTGIRFAPALIVWIGVQWWARGGMSGVLSDFSPQALRPGLEVWTDPLFASFAAYFLVTAAGALSVIAIARLDTTVRAFRRSPEIAVLCVSLAAYLLAARSDALLALGFLTPVWVLAAPEWIESAGTRQWWWIAGGFAITVATQRPFADVDVTSYYVDWHPYAVLRGSAPVQYAQLWDRWVPRFLVGAVAVWAVAIAGRMHRGSAIPEIPPARVAPPVHSELPGSRLAASLAALLGWIPSSIAIPASSTWRWAAYVYASILAGLTAYFLFGLPIQFSDSFGNLLAIQDLSPWEIFKAEIRGSAYLRPLLQVQLKIVYDLSRGHYFEWYRAVQALQVLAALLLTVSILKIRTVLDAAMLPLCLAALLGIHTFAGAIREAFPINTYLTLVLCCLMAVRIAQSRGGALVDAGAAALLAFAVLTLETGVLVWVIFIAAWMLGYSGVSRRTVVVATVVFAAYAIARFAVLNVGMPGLNERASGFGFRTLEPPEIVERFGRNPLPLYLYNYACAVFTVLFSEPRGAVWRLVADVARGRLTPWYLINVVVSTGTTGIIGWYVARRTPQWLRRRFDEGDRLVLLFIAVLLVNAGLCLVYVKDVIMSPAGAFYAMAAFVAIRSLVSQPARAFGRLSVAPVLIVAVLAGGWGWRMLGIHYNLRARAATARSEWAYEDLWEARNETAFKRPEARALKQTLMDDAIWRRPAPPRLDLGWVEQDFDQTQ
jgi:hypothetical protein